MPESKKNQSGKKRGEGGKTVQKMRRKKVVNLRSPKRRENCDKFPFFVWKKSGKTTAAVEKKILVCKWGQKTSISQQLS